MIRAEWSAIREFRNLSLVGKRKPSKVHSQNTLGIGRVRGAPEDQGRGTLGTRERKFFPDQITLGQSPVRVEVRVVAEPVLVTRGWEGKIGNSGFTYRVVTGEEREGGRERRVKRRRRRGLLRRCFFVALDPRQLAAGVENHLLGLRWGPYRERNDQSHRVFERRSVVVGRRVGGDCWWSFYGLGG